MPSEPKKPIEQMLEALAKARRAEFGDDPKMPNPMRARLHEEIARSGAAEQEGGESRPSWLTMFWPRLAVAAALATLIVLIPAIWWNQSHPATEVANVAVRSLSLGAPEGLNSAGSLEDALAKVPAASATETTVNLADNSQIEIEPVATPAFGSGALASSTRNLQGSDATESPGAVTNGVVDKEIAAAKIQAAPAAAPVPPADLKADSDKMAAAPAQPSSGDSLGTKQEFSRQSAVQSFRNNAQAGRAANVLNTFQVEQQGSEIRVFDADGSTYTGKIERSAKAAELDSRVNTRRAMAKQARSQDSQATGETESAVPQSYFRATGYNISLKKTLVFEGNYTTPAQKPAMATPYERERADRSSDRARIVGTVRVNGEGPVEVDAIAETPESSATKKNEK